MNGRPSGGACGRRNRQTVKAPERCLACEAVFWWAEAPLWPYHVNEAAKVYSIRPFAMPKPVPSRGYSARLRIIARSPNPRRHFSSQDPRGNAQTHGSARLLA